MKSAQYAAHNPTFEKMGLFRHPRWWRLKDKRPAYLVDGSHQDPTPTPIF